MQSYLPRIKTREYLFGPKIPQRYARMFKDCARVQSRIMALHKVVQGLQGSIYLSRAREENSKGIK
jgi:hypothetical protein